MGGEEDEMHDFELERMLAEAREQRDSSKTSQAAPKPLIVEDDLRWLLDKEDNGGSMKAGAAKQAQEELDGVAETVTKLRIAYGTLRNQTLRQQTKLEALEEELRLLQNEATSTKSEIRMASENQERRDATKARAAQMEQLADEQCEYTLTLKMLIKRAGEEKGGVEERLNRMREKLSLVEKKTARQTAEKGVIRHAQWQAKNGMQLQAQLNSSSKRARKLLVHQRQSLISKGRGDVASLSEELLTQQADLKRQAVQEAAEEDVGEASRTLQKMELKSRLLKLEAEFRKVQELMGFADMEAVVEKLIEQQGASVRMEQLKTDTIARQAKLVAEKAKLDVAYEEQLGGVDSELTKRRHSYDRFVRADEESQEGLLKRRVRMEELALLLTKSHIGLADIESRLASVPRLMLRGNLRAASGTAAAGGGRERDMLSTIADEDDKGDRSSVASPDKAIAQKDGGLGGVRDGEEDDGREVAARRRSDASEPAGGSSGTAGAADGARAKEAMAQSTSAQLEAMHEAEVQMQRALTNCESELMFLLHEIEKAATPAGRREQSAERSSAAPFGVDPKPSMAHEADGGMASAPPSASFTTRGRQSSVVSSELHAAPHAASSKATTFDYSPASPVKESMVPLGALNMRVGGGEEDAISVSSDVVIERTFADLNLWQLERTRLRSEALGVMPPAKGATTPGEGGSASARRATSALEHGADGAQSARGAGEHPTGGRRGSCDGAHPGSAPMRRGSVGAVRGGPRPSSSRDGSKASSQTSLTGRPKAVSAMAAPQPQPRAPIKPQPVGGPSPRSAGARRASRFSHT